jgi:glycosyltransferase involved in cell wall biosynthesis
MGYSVPKIRPGGKKPRIAVVVQRYGEEVNGGAELLARWLAERLTSLADVHAVTTCAVDYHTWANHYPAGESQLNGVTLHRFPVDAPRNWAAVQRMTQKLFRNDYSPLAELDWMRAQGPISTPLFNFINEREGAFDAFIFVTYLYATTFFGLPLVSRKAILVPAAHDEPYFYLPLFRPLFHLPQVIVYSTEAERQLTNRVMGNGRRPQIVAGVGVNLPAEASGDRFRQKFNLREPFILYVGRIDEGKNVPELFAHFQRFRAETAAPLKLVLIGKPHIPLPDHPDIISLGFLSEQDKFDGIMAATAVINPSLYESLSMIALEAWLMERPVLVNGRCEVLKQQCRASDGGLYYHNYDEFSRTLSRLINSPALRQQLGRQGQQFVNKNYRWEIILAKYQAVIETVMALQEFRGLTNP